MRVQRASTDRSEAFRRSVFNFEKAILHIGGDALTKNTQHRRSRIPLHTRGAWHRQGL